MSPQYGELLLPNFVDFVESVTDRPTDSVTEKKNNKRYVSAYYAATML